MEFLFLMCSGNSNLKLRKIFVFIFQCLISSTWFYIFLNHFHSFSMEYFFQNCSWQRFFKNSGICEYCRILTPPPPSPPKKSLIRPFYLQNYKNWNNGIYILKMLLKICGYDFTQWNNSLGKITSWWRPRKTSPYGPLCNAKGRPLPTSWGGLLQTLRERPHMV